MYDNHKLATSGKHYPAIGLQFTHYIFYSTVSL